MHNWGFNSGGSGGQKGPGLPIFRRVAKIATITSQFFLYINRSLRLKERTKFIFGRGSRAGGLKMLPRPLVGLGEDNSIPLSPFRKLENCIVSFDRELNPRPVDRKSDALLLDLQASWTPIGVWINRKALPLVQDHCSNDGVKCGVRKPIFH